METKIEELNIELNPELKPRGSFDLQLWIQSLFLKKIKKMPNSY
jgi:hypothetical protein